MKRSPFKQVTRRENDVWHACAQGWCAKETAQSLGIAESTVRTLRKQLFRKIGVNSACKAALAWVSKQLAEDADKSAA